MLRLILFVVLALVFLTIWPLVAIGATIWLAWRIATRIAC